MSPILGLAILLRLGATLAAVVFLFRSRDPRFGLLALMLGLMTLGESLPSRTEGLGHGLVGLAVSLAALGLVLLLARRSGTRKTMDEPDVPVDSRPPIKAMAPERAYFIEELEEKTAEVERKNVELEARNAEVRFQNAQLEAKNAELKGKTAEMEQFTYSVSHDLKSPLFTIQGFANSLKKDAARGRTARFESDIKKIQGAAETMGSLLDELSELSRVGRIISSPQEVDLVEVAREAVELVRGRIAERGVEVEISRELPVVVGDPPRLLQMFQNLIENAVKFLGTQPNPRIEIGARRLGLETVCFVRDNGVGIEPRYQDSIFGLFERLDRESEGCGIGLALVRRIVEVHGGRVWVESEGVGTGSEFCFVVSRPRVRLTDSLA